MRSRKGFTLVEIMVVILIIGILAGVLLPVIFKVRYEGQVTTVKGYLRAIGNGMESYKSDCGIYPENQVNSFVFYLLNRGIHAPHVDSKELKLTGAATLTTVQSTDAWGTPLAYFRAPILGIPLQAGYQYPSHLALKAALDAFKGNKTSFNLWSFGGKNLVDDSSTEAPAPFNGIAGGDADVADDIVNWQK